MKKSTISQAVVQVLITNNTGMTFRTQQVKILSLREAKKQPQEFLLPEPVAASLVEYCEAQNHPGLTIKVAPSLSQLLDADAAKEEADKAAADAAAKAEADKAAAAKAKAAKAKG